jgi:hypothetical protein
MHRSYHLRDQPIPAGFQIFEDRVEVAGIQYRKARRSHSQGATIPGSSLSLKKPTLMTKMQSKQLVAGKVLGPKQELLEYKACAAAQGR